MSATRTSPVVRGHSGLAALMLLVLAFMLAACAQPGARPAAAAAPAAAPVAPAPVAAPDARAIDAEVAAIMAGRHAPMPAPQALSRDAGSNVSEVRSTNATAYRLVLLYSGPTSQRLVLEPGAEGQVRLAPGTYRVSARVGDASANVTPFAGTRQLEAGSYTSRWVIESKAAAVPKGKGLPLTATARQVRDWVARVHKDPRAREAYADGGLAIEDFMAGIADSTRALMVVGDGSTVSGRCALLVVHADAVFPFERAIAGDGKPPCRSADTRLSFGGPGSRVTRGSPFGAIQSFTLRSTEGVDAAAPLQAEVRLRLDTLPAERLALRLTAVTSRSTVVLRSPPIALRRGENRIQQAFGPLQRSLISPVAAGPGDTIEGPVIVIADLTWADDGRSSQLLANSVATLIHVGR